MKNEITILREQAQAVRDKVLLLSREKDEEVNSKSISELGEYDGRQLLRIADNLVYATIHLNDALVLLSRAEVESKLEK